MEVQPDWARERIKITHNFGQVILTKEQTIELVRLLEAALEQFGNESISKAQFQLFDE